jgi:hypothetical protein
MEFLELDSSSFKGQYNVDHDLMCAELQINHYTKRNHELTTNQYILIIDCSTT